MLGDPRLFAGRLLVIDTETTGLDPGDGHRVVEIGCVELVGCMPSGREFHRYLNPCRAMPAGAQAVHGLTDAFLGGQPRFAEIVDEFLEFLADSPLIAHNANFDIAFLDHELRLCGRPCCGPTRAIDTLALARTRLPGAKHSLDALCTRYGVDRSARVKHGALLDAQLLAHVYLELIGGRQIGLALAHPAPAAAIGGGRAPERIRHPARAHAPSEEELARHAAFMATLADPLWLAA